MRLPLLAGSLGMPPRPNAEIAHSLFPIRSSIRSARVLGRTKAFKGKWGTTGYLTVSGDNLFGSRGIADPFDVVDFEVR
jgi:hypothetical protein